MQKKIEILGISLEQCYVDDIMEYINENWLKDVLSTYGVITMKLLMEAQEDDRLKEYIEMLDKTIVDEAEVLRVTEVQDEKLEEEASKSVFFPALFWFLSEYKNRVFLLGETEEEAEAFATYLAERYPDITILGREALLEGQDDHVDQIINEINSVSPHAVLACSGNLNMERFVLANRKKINTKALFCLGDLNEITQETGLKKGWFGKLMERNTFKKLVSQYNEEN